MDTKNLDRLRDKFSETTDGDILDLLVDIIGKHVESMPPAAGLRFLFAMDACLYELQGRLSVAYGGGVHTKHRHTRYHDFFTARTNQGERVLDVGCGIGFLAYDLAEKSGANVYGIDLNPDNIAVAQARYQHPNVAYIVGDVLKVSFEDPFDVVILSNVLEHLEDRPVFLRRLVRAVQPKRILIRVPLFERDWRVPLKEELGMDYRLDPTHYTEYTLESFASEIQAAHLMLTRQEVRWGEIWAEAAPQ
ncbi:MAG: class I SAM-dependent methyltransferase [Desulfomonile sp.]|jgi:ubiquinone/menaquinone biosynthesis C-methylase UbiE|nr:class I SAM-dependent methyltransferase [Deltaproteobacteria bacterium]